MTGMDHHSGIGHLGVPTIAEVALVLAVATIYVVGARRMSRRGVSWSAGRTSAFLGGLVLLAAAPVVGGTGEFAAHVATHLAVMMVAAPLLVAGAPLALWLAHAGSGTRQAFAETMDDPLVRGLTAGPWAGALLVLDYYGSMAVFLLTPLYRWSTESTPVHVAAHVYFLLCGLVFWVPLLGEGGPGWRPSRRTALTMILIGVPLNGVIALALLMPGQPVAPHDVAGTQQGGWTYLVGGVLVSLVGAAVVARRRASSPTPRREVVPWPAAS